MSCNECGKLSGDNMPRVCRVCELVDKDYTTKKVNYCAFCDAFICVPCETNLPKRAKAALINIRLK